MTKTTMQEAIDKIGQQKLIRVKRLYDSPVSEIITNTYYEAVNFIINGGNNPLHLPDMYGKGNSMFRMLFKIHSLEAFDTYFEVDFLFEDELEIYNKLQRLCNEDAIENPTSLKSIPDGSYINVDGVNYLATDLYIHSLQGYARLFVDVQTGKHSNFLV